jgi:hypothetical protein
MCKIPRRIPQLKVAEAAAMDPVALQQALAGTLSANQAERNAAEAALSGLDGAPGYLPCLFSVITSQQVQPAVRQAGSIYLKNLVGKHWQRKKLLADEAKLIMFTEEDKTAVRDGIFEALMGGNNQTRPQLADTLRKICHVDFPGE